jgi:hypothetical protein
MKKILLAFAGIRFSESVFSFVRRLNEQQPIMLVGVFLPEVMYSSIYSFSSGIPGNDLVPVISDEDSAIVEKNMTRFAELCQRNNITYRVHKDYDNIALPELKKETRFADLLILSSEKFFDSFSFNDPNPSLKDMLHATECAVVVVPEKFNFPDRTILAYDGSASSVYAIKQFAYLFPEMCGNETLLVYINEKDGTQLPDQQIIEELATQHFKNLEILSLQINARKYFNTWLIENKNALLVGGSFGRSPISELFHKSFVAEIISEHKFPVFIAHR